MLIFSIKFKKSFNTDYLWIKMSKILTFCFHGRVWTSNFKTTENDLCSNFKPKVQTLKPNQWEHIFVRIKKLRFLIGLNLSVTYWQMLVAYKQNYFLTLKKKVTYKCQYLTAVTFNGCKMFFNIGSWGEQTYCRKTY